MEGLRGKRADLVGGRACLRAHLHTRLSGSDSPTRFSLRHSEPLPPPPAPSVPIVHQAKRVVPR